MSHYILSKKTEDDINAIYDYGSERFGKRQSLNYIIDLRAHFELLSTNPDIGRRRDEIKEGLFSFSYAAHIIFYRIF